MNTTFDILVIVLSSLLGLFLILSIICIALVLKLVGSLRRVVAKGENLVDNVEEIGETIRNNVGAVSVLRLFSQFAKIMNKVKK